MLAAQPAPSPLIAGPSPTPQLSTVTPASGVEMEMDNSNLDDSSIAEDASAPLESQDTKTFKPLFVLGVWKNESEDKRISIAILMPSGTCVRKKDHSIAVVGDGMFLEVSVIWPKALCDLEYLHKHWLQNDSTFLSNNPRLTSFRTFLRRLRKTKDQPIQSTCRIKLPFQVKSELAIAKRNTQHLSWTSGEVVLYVTLEAPDANYEAEQDDEVTFFKSLIEERKVLTPQSMVSIS